MKLYHNPMSPNCRKVLMTAEHLGMDVADGSYADPYACDTTTRDGTKAPCREPCPDDASSGCRRPRAPA